MTGCIEDVRKIAVLRVNGIGDFLVALPALAALKATYRQAELTLLGSGWHAEFLRGRPGPVDRVVVVPPIAGVGAAHDHPVDRVLVDRFVERMRQERFDLALQLHGGGRYSNPLTVSLGARVTAGLRAADAIALDRWVPYVFYQPEVVRYLDVVDLVGAPPVALRPRLHVLPSDLAEVDAVLPPSDRPLAVLNPGASDPRRRWPAERFAGVGDALTEAGAAVVVNGGGEEVALAQQVVDGMRGQASSLAGRLSVRGLAGLLASASVVVSNDTGPLHLADAVGTANVGIYWCGNAINAAPMSMRRRHVFLSWQLHCAACGLDCTKHDCGHSESFVSDVPLQAVADAAVGLLSE